MEFTLRLYHAGTQVGEVQMPVDVERIQLKHSRLDTREKREQAVRKWMFDMEMAANKGQEFRLHIQEVRTT